MHEPANIQFLEQIKRHNIKPKSILDVGSFDVNGSYRQFFPGIDYTGVDIREGKGVDIVMDDPKKIPLPDFAFDLIVSGSCIEHAVDPWALVREMARCMRKGGYLVINAPFAWPLHNHPDDFWRFAPSGMRALIEGAGLECKEAYHKKTSEKGWTMDCFGVGYKAVG